MRTGRTASINVRIREELKARIEAACIPGSHGPYNVTITSLIEHGLELALAELEKK